MALQQFTIVYITWVCSPKIHVVDGDHDYANSNFEEWKEIIRAQATAVIYNGNTRNDHEGRIEIDIARTSNFVIEIYN